VTKVHQGSKSAVAKGAKSAVEVGKCDKIIADLYFFVAFGEAYFKKHMKWLHDTNPLLKTFGHSCHEMPICAAMMKWEIENDAWKENPYFNNAMAKCNDLADDAYDDGGSLKVARKATTMKQWEDFFIVFRDTLVKHTRAWYGKDLLPFAIASSDKDVASIFAASLIGCGCVAPLPIQSPVHKCKIDLQRWKEFLAEMKVTDLLQSDYILSRHQDAISSLAIMGVSLWESQPRENTALLNLKFDCQRLILAVKHHQPSGEAAVRDIGICSRTGRGEKQSSPLTSFRSLILSSVSILIKEKMTREDRNPKPNVHRGVDYIARYIRAKKQDDQGNNEKSQRVRPTKERSTMNIVETLSTFGENKNDES
jgi:hypothetical protein